MILKLTRNRVYFLVFCVTIIFASCGNTKNVPYFQNITQIADTTLNSKASFAPPVIMIDDILSINIYTIDPENSYLLNQASNNQKSVQNQSPLGNSINGFLVDKNGEIDIALIGKVKLQGLNTSEAKDLISEKISKLYNNTSVEVRFANFRITILGEVNHPSTYIIPNEKVTILDAIGLAGDLTIYGKRDNILLIRTNEDKKHFVRFNLNNTDLFQNKYFYLMQNDVIYIEPNKAKAASLNAARTQTYTLIGSILSLIAIIATRNI